MEKMKIHDYYVNVDPMSSAPKVFLTIETSHEDLVDISRWIKHLMQEESTNWHTKMNCQMFLQKFSMFTEDEVHRLMKEYNSGNVRFTQTEK
jgi:hypothetical protein